MTGAFILLYHRIAEPAADPWQLSVSAGHFSEHLEVLRRHSHVVPLGQMIRDIDSGTGVEDCVAITLDDGYADNLMARDILEQGEAPGTVFIATGYVGGHREFWWDELDRVLLQPGSLPAVMHLSIDNAPVRVALGEAATYSSEEARLNRRWRAYDDEPPGSRQAAYLSLWERLVSQPATEQRRVLGSLVEQAGIDAAPRASHRPMTRDEIASIARSRMIELGAHTVTHPTLPAWPLTAQRDEIALSKADLEEMVGRPIEGFAYPHGRYTPESVGLVRDAGYACAVRPHPGSRSLTAVRPDRYLLPRVTVPDWDGDTFERMLLHGFEY